MTLLVPLDELVRRGVYPSTEAARKDIRRHYRRDDVWFQRRPGGRILVDPDALVAAQRARMVDGRSGRIRLVGGGYLGEKGQIRGL